MTTSNAVKTDQNREHIITVSCRGKRPGQPEKTGTKSAAHTDKSLRTQKLAGAAVLAVSLSAALFGGEFSAAAVMAPPALAAIFSKEKILDFGIFGRTKKQTE
ncbi:MAG: hypothetical protein NC395_10330 [Prevotella sp.]|nr:hypothetical protein [Prevotella sp.]